MLKNLDSFGNYQKGHFWSSYGTEKKLKIELSQFYFIVKFSAYLSKTKRSKYYETTSITKVKLFNFRNESLLLPESKPLMVTKFRICGSKNKDWILRSRHHESLQFIRNILPQFDMLTNLRLYNWFCRELWINLSNYIAKCQ